MRILITGARGMLATDLAVVLAEHELTLADRRMLDLTDPASIERIVPGHDVVINTAAWTDVDGAESDESGAREVNAVGAGTLARTAAGDDARFIQLSTDYVFDGSATRPYPEDAPHSPISAYGRTKAEGESLVLRAHPGAHIVRTAWLYGRNGSSFPRTMLGLARRGAAIRAVTDQRGQPTWSMDVARAIALLIEESAAPGIYHATNSGETTWHGLAREVLAHDGFDPDSVGVTVAAEFQRPAPRPNYSVLAHDAWGAAGLPAPRSWSDALAEAMSQRIFGDR